MRALDRDGKPIEFEADGLLAVCIQHEMDHLDGKLFVDYLSELKRTRIRKKLEKERKERGPGSARSGAESPLKNNLSIVFAGTPEFAVPALEALLRSPHRVVAVYTQPDRPAGRGQQLAAERGQAVRSAARLAHRATATLREPAAVERLQRWSADLMVVAAYGLLLAASGPANAAARLRQHSCVAAAALARRRADSARDRRRRCAKRRDDHADGRWPRHGADAARSARYRSVRARPRRACTIASPRSVRRRCSTRSTKSRREQRRRAPQPAEGVTYAAKIRKEEARSIGRVPLRRSIGRFAPSIPGRSLRRSGTGSNCASGRRMPIDSSASASSRHSARRPAPQASTSAPAAACCG